MKINKKIKVSTLLIYICSFVYISTYIFLNSHACSPCAGGCCQNYNSIETLFINILNSTAFNIILVVIVLLIIFFTIYLLILLISNLKKLTKASIIKSIIGITVGSLILIFFIIRPFIINLTQPEFPVAYKPIIYIYPTDDVDLSIEFSNPQNITHSYPKYNDKWDVRVSKNGNIYDKRTKRNYYALYWEGLDNTKIDTTEGFVIKGKDTSKFLEQKLEILGLNDREINEFIIYWLPKLENNKYNYIRFRSKDEIDNYMDLKINQDLDSEIRVFMDYKVLDKKIKVKEQKLNKVKRTGFTLVEWGGRQIN